MLKKRVDKGRLNFVYRNFLNGISFIRKSRKYIWISIFIFFIAVIIGYSFPGLFKEQVLNILKELSKQTENLGFFGLVRFIIFNNIKSSFLGLILGIFIALIPFGILIVNGYVLGFVMNAAVKQEGIFVLWKLLPHGIFELPAIFISVGLGIKIGLFYLNAKDKLRSFLAILTIILGFVVFSLFFSSIFISFSFERQYLISNLSNLKEIILNNPYIYSILTIINVLVVFLSIYLGLLVFSRKDRTIVISSIKNNFKNSLITFVFVVIPLLVMAGIIEAILIVLIK